MTVRRARTAAQLLLAALTLALFGCGGDDNGDDEGGQGKQGGSITISQTTQPDFMDPALSYQLAGWEPMWLVYKGLIALPAQGGPGGGTADPGRGRGAADDLARTARPTS